MAIGPDGLDGVIADRLDPEELEGRGGEGAVGSFVQLAEGVDLAFAPGAWAGTAEVIEADEGLGSVVPADGEFVADDLEVDRAHAWFGADC
jgi:hypothetical protein